MLTKHALMAAVPLAVIMDSSNKWVAPLPGSPLAEIIGALPNGPMLVAEDENGFSLDVANTLHYANNSQLGCLTGGDVSDCTSPYIEMIDKWAEVGIRAVSEQIAMARTIVAPFVKQVADSVLFRLKEMESAAGKLEIIEVYLPAPLYNDKVRAIIEKYAHGPRDLEFSPKVTGPVLSASELRELLKTGSSADEEIGIWASSISDDVLISYWETMFTNVPAVGTDAPSLLRTGAGALFSFLLANRLMDETIPGFTMPLARYEEVINSVRQQAALALKAVIDLDDESYKVGVVIIGSNDGRKIMVNARTYAKWMENGGDVEAIYGSTLVSGDYRTIAELDSAKTSLIGAWERHVGLTRVVENNRRYETVRSLMAGYFRQHLSEEYALAAGADGFIDVARLEDQVKLFEDALGFSKEEDYRDIYTLSLRCCCHARWRSTGAEEILFGIQEACRLNPELDPREASTGAVYQYVSKYVAQQLTVNSL